MCSSAVEQASYTRPAPGSNPGTPIQVFTPSPNDQDMVNAITLYGSLILTVVGFIVPILTILISLFPEGVKSLSSKYENERKQSEENILNEIEKKETKKGLDYKALQKTLKTLKKNRREAELKLTYLKPIQFLLKTSFPFIISFIGVLIALLSISLIYTVLALIFSFLSFIGGVMALFISVSLLFEVAEIVNQKKNTNEEKIIELLSTLVAQSDHNLYLKEHKVKVKFNGEYLKKDAEVTFSTDKIHKVPISIENSSEMMAKTVEVGFIFPKDFVIEKTSNLSIYTDTSSQIVRFKREIIQAHENNQQGELQITFLKIGESNVDIFIKGENIKYQRFSFKLRIIK